ncbi:MAG: hypothetical protein ACLFS4_05860 [Opitutales bacterium]
MLKKLFLFLVLLLVAAAAVVYFAGGTILNKSVKTGIETFGPKITQTSVELDKVDLSVLSGSGTLSGLIVGNPEGFKAENSLSLDQIKIDVDLSSLFKDKVVINSIHIIKPAITYEKTMRSSNIKELMKNIEAFKGEAEEPPEDAPKPGKQLVIRKLVIEDGALQLGTMGASATGDLPRIEMTDLGEKEGTESIAGMIQHVLGEVLKSTGTAVDDLRKNLQDQGDDALEKGKDQGLDSLENTQDSIQGLFDN